MLLKRSAKRKLLTVLSVFLMVFVVIVAGAGAAKKSSFLAFLLGVFFGGN